LKGRLLTTNPKHLKKGEKGVEEEKKMKRRKELPNGLLLM